MATMQLPDALGAQGDDALMSRIAARDALAFRLLIERHADRPHRIAWRMLGDATEAEDVAQEAMLRLWQNAASWRGGGPGVAAWLTRVATNICVDRLRQRRRIERRVQNRALRREMQRRRIEAGVAPGDAQPIEQPAQRRWRMEPCGERLQQWRERRRRMLEERYLQRDPADPPQQ